MFEDKLVLEEKFGLIRVLQVDAKHIVGVDRDQDAEQLLGKWRLVHAIAKTAVYLQITCQLLRQSFLPLFISMAEKCLHD